MSKTYKIRFVKDIGPIPEGLEIEVKSNFRPDSSLFHTDIISTLEYLGYQTEDFKSPWYAAPRFQLYDVYSLIHGNFTENTPPDLIV